MNQISEDKPRLFPAGKILPFILVTALFMFWGIAVNMNDVLIKQFMKSFEITRFAAGFIQTFFFFGYFALAMPAALIMRKYNYKTGLIIGLFLYALGTFLFWPAAIIGKYLFFLVALFVIASGLSFLETGANPFIATLGDSRTSEQRLNFSQAFNPLGAIIGVAIGTVFIFSGIELSQSEIEVMKAAGEYDAYLQSEIIRVVKPYLIIGAVMFLWALLLLRTRFPKTTDEDQKNPDQPKGRFKDLFKHSHFVQGVLAQFFYVGAQVGTWSFFIQYMQDYTGEPEKVAGSYLIGSLVAFGVGRFFSTFIMKYVKPQKLMGLFSIINVILVFIGVVYPGWVGLWAVLLTSFFMSLMFPTIFALGIKGLGPDTKIGGSMIIMAIIGGAAMTPIMGLISDSTGSMALAMIVPLVCYVFIAYYAFIGSKVRIPVKV
ncbi:MAG: L-fucose:H+ symporter permease [Bacteroidales bacterium]|nr:L-fucose:H+ symporter permease [Bacteroidales bacterium]